jgi:hypothetical protein
MVDAQLDGVQREALQIKFSPYDLPSDQFLTGGQAWQRCRMGQADADSFGISGLHGLWFVRGNLVRDMASLNKTELLPWDGWGLIEGDDQSLSPADWALLDRAAVLTQSDDSLFHEMRSTYLSETGLRVPPVVRSYTAAGPRPQDWTTEQAITP